MNLQPHLDRAASVRLNPNFVKLPAQDLVELIDAIICQARHGCELDDHEREKLRPFCMAADAAAGGRNQVALRCEDYYWLVQLANRLITAPTTTPPPWQPASTPPPVPATPAAAADPQPPVPATPPAAKPRAPRRRTRTTPAPLE